MKGDSGFTLVELMVSISIIILMMAVGLPAFQAYGRKAELSQVATDIQLALLQAHNLALAPEIDKPSEVDYYGVKFASQSFDVIRGVRGVSVCPGAEQGGSSSFLAAPSQIEHHQLPAGISIQTPPNYCIGYVVGTGASPVVGSPNAVTVHSSRIATGSTTQQILVNPVTGQVTVNILP